MSSEVDPSDFRQQESDGGFEKALQNLALKPVQLDLSPVDQCVVSSDVLVASTASPQWRLASASWLVGLATGLLIAILGGGAFRTQDVPLEDRISQAEAAARPKAAQEPAITARNTPAPSTATNPPSTRWSSQTDYIAEFSPTNNDLAHRISIASRDLLVSFRVDTPELTVRAGAGHAWSDSQSQPPASLGELRKQLQLAL